MNHYTPAKVRFLPAAQYAGAVRKSAFLYATFCAFAFAFTGLAAHDVRWEAERQKFAVVLSIHYGDGSLFAFEQYEVFAPSSETPFQVGRTDGMGRVVFLPDREGEWKIRFVSDDGHGGEALIPVSKDEAVQVQKRSLFDRFGPALTGVSLLFGLFGIYALFQKRKRSELE